MILLSAYYALLQRYSRETELFIGVSSPARLDVHCVVADLSPDLTFRELVQRIQAIYATHSVQNKIDDSLTTPSAPAVQSILQVGDNTHDVTETIPGYQCPLWISAFPAEDPSQGLSVIVHYSKTLFTEATARRMSRHFENILRAAIADPSTPVCRLPLIDTEEEKVLLNLRGELRAHTGPTTLKEVFEAQAARTPDNVALEDSEGKKALTYAQLNSHANQLARFLQSEYKVRGNVTVALSTERTPETMVGLLAILKAGGAYVPIDPEVPVERLRLMAKDACFAAILCGKVQSAAYAGAGLAVVVVDADALAPTGCIGCLPADDLPLSHVGQDMAYIIFTSGSSGTPKGVMVRNICLS